MSALLLMCMLFLLRESIEYGSTPAPVSDIPVMERSGYISPRTSVFVIHFEREVWLCEHSYSFVCCLCEGEV